MPLPEGGKTAWPPANIAPVTERLCAWSAWYSGNPDELEHAYGGASGAAYDTTSADRIRNHPSQYRGGVIGKISRFFWGEPVPSNGQKRTKLHVPIASDIATASADLLFSEPPTVTVSDGETETSSEDGTTKPKKSATQARLETLLDEAAWARLTEAAEVSAALGGVYLRTCWDKTLADKPWLTAIHADAAVPEWRWDQLTAVTFWRVLSDDGKEVVRHLERHEKGLILHGVYEGTPTELGKPMNLKDFPETETLQPSEPTGIDRLTATYVPNMRPNRLWRNLPAAAPLGRADIAGVEPLLDALDEVWSSWMRDIRNGKGRMVVPETYLESNGPGRGSRFDAEREVWEQVNMLGDPSRNQLQVVQFEIRVQEHRDTALDLMEQILRGAGHSPQTFGLKGDTDGGSGAVTATEIDARHRKSNITRDKKINYMAAGLADAIWTLLAIDQMVYPEHGVTPQRPDIEFGDAVSVDMATLAQSAQLLRAAEAASTETLVQMVHPEWDDDQVKAEAKAIQDEAAKALSMSDPGGGMESPGSGAPGEAADEGAGAKPAGGAGARQQDARYRTVR